MTDTPTLTIGEVSDRTGLSVHALRFWEREGILAKAVHRDSGGRRRYSEDDVDWLTLCIVLRESGMPVPEIRRYTELVRAGDGNEEERLVVLRAHEQRILAQQAALSRSMDLIRFKIGVYEDHLDQTAHHGCVIVDEDRQLSAAE
jgi:DNA-binding transcriptional MerR regulator